MKFSFKNWFLNEAATVKQALSKMDNVKETMKQVGEILDKTFEDHLNPQQKADLNAWFTFHIMSDPNKYLNVKNYLNNFLQSTKDYIASEINSKDLNFRDTAFSLLRLQAMADLWHQDLKKNSKIGAKGAIGKMILSFEDGWKWVYLDKHYCSQEKRAMGHCGNQSGKKEDRILSLRDRNNAPYLTFIVNNGSLGESKGRFNKKPESKFHKYIVPLLMSEYITDIKGGGYLPMNNFSMYDLDKSIREKIYKEKPSLKVGLVKDAEYSPNTIAQNLAHFVELENYPEYVKSYFNVKKNIGKPTYDNFIKYDYLNQKLPDANIFLACFNESQQQPQLLAFAYYMVRRPLDTFVKKLILEQAPNVELEETEALSANRFPLYDHFLILLAKEDTNLFDQVMDKIPTTVKSDYIHNMIKNGIKVDEKYYKFLDDYQIKALQKHYFDQDKKLPDGIKKTHDYISAKQEDESSQNSIVDIIEKALLSLPVSNQQIEFFNRVCDISYEDVRNIKDDVANEIKEDAAGIYGDEDDEKMDAEVAARTKILANLLVPIVSSKSNYGNHPVPYFCSRMDDDDLMHNLYNQDESAILSFVKGIANIVENDSVNLPNQFYVNLLNLVEYRFYACVHGHLNLDNKYKLNAALQGNSPAHNRFIDNIIKEKMPKYHSFITKILKKIGKEVSIVDILRWSYDKKRA